MRVWSSLTRRISASYAVARGQWSSETRFGYSYNWLTRTDPWYNTVDPKAPSSADHRGVPRLAFTGLTTPEGEQHERGTLPSYSFEQQMTRVTDRHAFKFGGIYFPFRGGRVNYAAPSDSFQNIDDLINNRAQIALSFPSPESTWTTLNWGVFFQDDWRLNSKLVVNMGVRYDYFGRYVIKPKDESQQAGIVNLDGLQDQSFHFGPQRPLDSIYDDDKGLNLGPRIGFAYNVDGAGHLIINGGWGMMFQPFDTQNFEPSIGNVQLPRNLTYSVQEAAARGLGWPTYSNDVGAALLAQGGPPIVGILIDPQLQAPSAMVNTLGFQRTLGSSRVLEASYVGTRGYDISLYRTYNQPDRITGLRPNPSLNQASYYDNSQSTNYHSMQLSFRQRPVRHFSYNVNYTWSKALAQAGGDGTPGFIGDSTANVQDFFDVDSEWGPASGDITHLGVGSVIYEIPEGNFSKPAARDLLGGWQIAGIFRLATGQPLLMTQSSQIGGSRPDVIDFANAINPACCGVGNLQYPEPRRVPAGADQRDLTPDDPARQHRQQRLPRSRLQESRSVAGEVDPVRRRPPARAAGRHAERVEHDQLPDDSDRDHRRQFRRGDGHGERARDSAADPLRILTALNRVMMRIKVFFLSALLSAGAAAFTAEPMAQAAGQAAGTPAAAPRNGSLVGEDCVGCHNDRVKRGDLVLSHLDESRVAAGRPDLGESYSQSALGDDASGQRAAARCRPHRRLPRVARSRRWTRPARHAEPGEAGPAPAEPHRVRQFDPRPARLPDRRHLAAASRRQEPWLRQHRGEPHHLADVDGELHQGRRCDRADGGRRSRRSRLVWKPIACRRPSRRRSMSRDAARHARRHRRPPFLSGRRRIHLRDVVLSLFNGKFFGALQESRADRGVGGRRARGAAGRQPEDARDRRDCGRKPIKIAAGPAAGVGRVHQARRGTGPGLRDAVRDGVEQSRRRGPWRDRSPSSDHARHQRPAQRHRRQRYAEPAQDFHLPPDGPAGRRAVCAQDSSRRWRGRPFGGR